MAHRLILTDGTRNARMNIKDASTSFGIDPWQDETPGVWVPDKSAIQLAKDTRLVPSMYSGIYARSQAMADLPFSIYSLDNANKQLADSAEWDDPTGFLTNPSQTFWQTEASLCTYGQCYFFRVQGTITGHDKGLKYWMPDTVTPKFDKVQGLVNFHRNIDNKDYSPDQVFQLWLPDPSVEIGPPVVYPFASAMKAGEANGAITGWVAEYMKRGAIKAMLLAVDGLPNDSERQRIETWFNRFMAGARGLGWKLFNASSVKPTVVGDGLDALKGLTVNTDLRYDIHTALGTRHLLEDENFATANARERQFINYTIMPDARFIQHRWNETLLNPMRMRLEFEPERLQSFENLKAERAAAWANAFDVLVQTISPDAAMELSMDMLGFDLTEEQKVIFLKGLDDKGKQKAADQAAALAQAQAQPKPDVIADPLVKPGPTGGESITSGIGEKSHAIVELDKWEAKVTKAGKMITWHAVDLPEEIYQAVKSETMTFEQARDKLRNAPRADAMAVVESIKQAVTLFVAAKGTSAS